MMNLDEAIQHCEEKAKEWRQAAGRFAYPDKAGTTKESADCLECAEEYEQLAEWLTELKNMKDCIKTECFKCAKDKATSDNAPTVVNEYTKGFADGERSGRHFPLTDEEKAILVRQWRSKGEWIRTGSLGNGNAHYECSECHYGDEHAESQEVPYCWHCGAEMKGGTE